MAHEGGSVQAAESLRRTKYKLIGKTAAGRFDPKESNAWIQPSRSCPN